MPLRKKKITDDEWKIDTGAADGDGDVLCPPRLRLVAVRALGYTHTEAGYATVAQIIEMLDADRWMRGCGDAGAPEWIDKEII